MDIDMSILIDVVVYPNGDQHELPPSNKSDDYEKRKTAYCNDCRQNLWIDYAEPFAGCNCGTTEWYL